MKKPGEYAEYPLNLVDSIWDCGEWVNKGEKWVAKEECLGRGKYYEAKGHTGPAGLLFACPGCAQVVSIAFIPIDGKAFWQWNGNRELPTATPSILHNRQKGGCGWHGYLVDGFFKGKIE